jgi:hypothetical protein
MVLLETLILLGQVTSLGIALHRLAFSHDEALGYAVTRTVMTVLIALGVFSNYRTLTKA